MHFSFKGTGGLKRAQNAFLFSLVNPGGLPPTKIPLILGQEGHAINCGSSCGPVFGDGTDLYIASVPNSNNCSVNLNSTYQCPAGQNEKTFLTGNQYFTISELEVFGFEK